MLLCTATINAKKPLLPAPTPSAQDQFASHELSATAFTHIPSDAKKESGLHPITLEDQSIDLNLSIEPAAPSLTSVITPTETPSDDQAEAAVTTVAPDDKKADLDFCVQAVNEMGTEGFNPDALSPSGVTALQLLTFYYMHGIIDADQAIEELLKNKATVDIQGPILKTPLFFITAYTALTNQATQQAVISSEVQSDENTETVTAQAQKPTTLMFQNSHSREKNLALLNTLLSYGANPFIADENKNTPFDIAVQTQDMDILNMFAKYEWFTIVELTEEELLAATNAHTDRDVAAFDALSAQ